MNVETPCKLLRYNPRRRARGTRAAEVEIDGEVLWMSLADIKNNIKEFGPLQGLLDALEAYKLNRWPVDQEGNEVASQQKE